MPIKEIFKKYKLYTMLCIITLVLITSGIILGMLLLNSTPSTKAFTYQDYEIEITSDGITITGYTGSFTALPIPAILMGIYVTSIGTGAFEGDANLTDVIIPDSVTSIGSWAFRDCSVLTSVTIGNSVTSIGSSAFQNCTDLTLVYFYNDITTTSSIGSSAFTGGNSNVTYYFKDQTSLNNALTYHSDKFSNTNFETFGATITAQPNNETYGSVSGGGWFENGTSCTLQATANNGYRFLGWDTNGDGQADNTSTPWTFNVSQDLNCTAIFEVVPTVTIQTNDSTLGQIFANNVLGNSTTIQVQSGGAVSNIMALAVGGNAFAYWQIDRGDGNITTSTENPLSLNNITADTTVTAVFANSLLENFAVASIGGGEARINGYTEGDSYIHLSAFCYTGYTFAGWYYADAETPFSTDKSIDLDISTAESKLIIARFVPTNSTNNGQTDTGNSGVL